MKREVLSSKAASRSWPIYSVTRKANTTSPHLIISGLEGPPSGVWMAPTFSVLQSRGWNQGIARTVPQKIAAVIHNPAFIGDWAGKNLASKSWAQAFAKQWGRFIYMPTLVTGINESISYLNLAYGSFMPERKDDWFSPNQAGGTGWLGMLTVPSYAIVRSPSRVAIYDDADFVAEVERLHSKGKIEKNREGKDQDKINDLPVDFKSERSGDRGL